LDDWLRGPLRDWAESLLSEQSLHAHGLFDFRKIRNKWQEHLSCRRNWQDLLWDVLVFQAWYFEQGTRWRIHTPTVLEVGTSAKAAPGVVY